MRKRKEKKKSWGKEDKEILIWAVSKFCQLNEKNEQIDDMVRIVFDLDFDKLERNI